MKVNFKSRKFISLLLAVVLIICSASAALIYAAQAQQKAATEPTYRNNWEKLVAEGGYMNGVFYYDLQGYEGNTFSNQELLACYSDHPTDEGYAWKDGWTVQGKKVTGAERVREDMYNMQALGFNTVQIYALGNQCEAIDYTDDKSGDIVGLDPTFKANWTEYLQIIADSGIKTGIVMQIHERTLYTYYGKQYYDLGTQYYYNPVVREHYMERCVKPMLQIIKDIDEDHKAKNNGESFLMFIALADEPMNMVNDNDLKWNVDNSSAVYGTTWDNMFTFLSELNDLVIEYLPDVARTVDNNVIPLNRFDDLDLDFYGYNNYMDINDSTYKSFARPYNEFQAQLPMIASEYGTANWSGNEDTYASANVNMLKNLKSEGYYGSFWWQWMWGGEDELQTMFNTNNKSGADSGYDFRKTAISFMRENYNGTYATGTDDNGVMLYNNGSGNVAWVNPESLNTSTTIVLERKVGDGSWTQVTSNTAANLKYSKNSEMGYYNDSTNLTNGQTVQYRVKIGNKSYSEPSNAHVVNK